MSFFFRILVLAILFAPAASTAYAAVEPVVLGVSGSWKALTFDQPGRGGGKVCFMSAKPKKEEGKYTKRGDVAFFITHWAGEDTRDVVSVSIGYAFKKGSKLTVTVDGRDYDMLTDGEMAWAADSKTDHVISEAVQKGSKMVVKGRSQRGTLTTDTYDLTGSGDAYKTITEACFG